MIISSSAPAFSAPYSPTRQKKREKSCLVIDRRNHIAGNIYCERILKELMYINTARILFHTNNKAVWEYVNQFAEFNNYINSPIAVYKGRIVQPSF